MMSTDGLIALVTFTLLMTGLLVGAWWATRDKRPPPPDPRAQAVIRRIDESEREP